ncbi:RnfABCDGE type electron transport complex subunit D, partial [Wenyingzhuangia sp. 1_MG-2023]|nr:RnfABCDGE type electron transport complex subunit D [Wenyingzhuangia sp. 1_MG-2023]
AEGGVQAIIDAGVSWSDAFFGTIQGSMGETSTLAILLGGVVLLVMNIAAWRIVAGVFGGMVVFSLLLNMIGSDTNYMFALPWYW